MSLQKRIASRLTQVRRSLKRRTRKQRPSNRFTLERLEERQLLAADFLAGEVIVQFDASMTEEMRASVRPAGSILVETIHTAMMQRVGEGVMERLQLNDSVSIDQAIEYYKGVNGVQFAEPNFILTAAAVSNDNYYTNGSLWGMFSDDTPTAIGPGGTTNQFGSQAEKAWDQDILGSSDVIVGVIDTGVQVDHPDLVNNIWVNPFDAVDGIDNDGNGYVDDTWGWDFAGNDRIVYDSTADDHGTHVAGTIGAEGGNSIGVAGVNWDVTMVSLKFLAPSGSITNAIRAVDYLTDLKVRHNLNIVASNNSWGGGGYSTGLHAAIIRSAKSDILFFAAAGNSASNNDVVNAYPSNYSTLVAAGSTTPASYDGVVAVANITSTGSLSGSSSYGRTTVDIGAPGNNIWSTLPAGSYGSFSGTSMATPHVAGAAALYKSHYPTATAEQIRDVLLNTAKPTPSLNGRVVTDGRLDVAAMLAAPPVPSITISNETVVEGDSGLTQVIFTVTLSEASTDVITVDYSTRGGSATPDIDYVSISGTLTFNPGETTQTIAVDVYGDTDVELREDFFVDLTNPTNAMIDFPFGVGEIISEDTPEVSIQDVSIIEGNSGYQALYFTFVLSDRHSENVSIVYSTEDGSAKSGSDYQGVSGSLVIPAGEVSGTVRINIIGDSIIEDNETFYLRLYAAEQAILNDDAALATIINDDSEQGIAISDSAVLEGNSGRKSIYFTVSLQQPSKSFITIHYATRNNTATTADRDYVAVSGQVSIRPGATSATIAVPVLGDRKAEQDETFFVDLIRAFGAVISDGLAVGRIFNDDAGKVIPTPPPAANGFSSLAEVAASASAAALSPTVPPAANSGGSNPTGAVSLMPLTGSNTRLVPGPKLINSNNLTQMLAINRIGPRVTESFAASVDLALVALLKDGERLAKLG